MAETTNPISGPYSGVPVKSYSENNVAKFNRAVTATGPFLATGSYANSSGFYVSGSSATVTLTNGGSISVPAPAAANPADIYEFGVYSVISGTVILLYK